MYTNIFKRRTCGRFLEKSFCYLLIFVINPSFFIFEILVVRPIVVKTYNLSQYKHVFHIMCSTFCFINIIGNMMLCILTGTSLKGTVCSDSYCAQCETNRPAAAWHCATCNTCVLRRDHHCFFLSRCIGLQNQRYYILYVGYLFIALGYSTYYNYYYILTKFEDDDLYLSVFRVLNPLLRYVTPEPLAMKELYVLFLFLNSGLVIWSGVLFWFHMRNVFRGVTAREYKHSRGVAWVEMKKNFVSVFGTRWYWAILWPLADSPLPTGGIKYD
ncbi:probable palmitoyltransferase ZDHHC24 [Vanessa tameamea]|uniref:Palmitoyltransferase n=1 Tax=Vanessa tameamea TaxID=334116 RepID=A0ABM4AII4_VANTA